MHRCENEKVRLPSDQRRNRLMKEFWNLKSFCEKKTQLQHSDLCQIRLQQNPEAPCWDKWWWELPSSVCVHAAVNVWTWTCVFTQRFPGVYSQTVESETVSEISEPKTYIQVHDGLLNWKVVVWAQTKARKEQESLLQRKQESSPKLKRAFRWLSWQILPFLQLKALSTYCCIRWRLRTYASSWMCLVLVK